MGAGKWSETIVVLLVVNNARQFEFYLFHFTLLISLYQLVCKVMYILGCSNCFYCFWLSISMLRFICAPMSFHPSSSWVFFFFLPNWSTIKPVLIEFINKSGQIIFQQSRIWGGQEEGGDKLRSNKEKKKEKIYRAFVRQKENEESTFNTIQTIRLDMNE